MISFLFLIFFIIFVDQGEAKAPMMISFGSI
ncbi:hypothetical protein GLYMA_20G138850v4 [Glycine max]|nr:hypothetical protein GLYMA_20G138850v4 [Glycine max]